ncbi:insulinase family protein [Hyphomicrobiaceae bacterium 22]|uniref:Insulinase family protein n=2 Tax=Prosthecodimorpha staleyi TaxID=2840188 RepID=A0A947DAX0_9HYPH|nr:insulinase family protein [Prosthecodimorpha staleyi]
MSVVRQSIRRATGALALAAGIGLTALAAGPAEAVQIQRVVSPGGIEAWLVEEQAVPLIAVNFAFKGGNAQDPDGKAGLANLLSTLLDEGAGDMDGQTFQGRLEDLSIRLAFEDSRDAFYGEMKTLSAHRDEAFDLLRLSLTKPRFDDDAVERMRVQAISGLRREKRDPDTVASRLWARSIFPNHPYGRPSNGDEASVAAITVQDIRDFHGRVFARDGLKIGVVGAIDAKTLAPLLDRVFGDLPARQRLTPVAEVAPLSGLTVSETIPNPQTVIRLSAEGLKRKDPDFIAAYVMNHILGGGSFSSWLYTEVREKRGLAYSVYTSLAPYDHTGVFYGGLGTRADRAAESIRVIRDEIKRMAEVGPTPAELDKAKSYLTGSYALRFDTSDKIAGQLLAIQMDDLGIDYIDKRNALVDAVTLADVKRVAARLLSKPLTVVTVGPGGS